MEPSQSESQDNDRPCTPPRPPYSPVTPVFAHLAPVPGPTKIIPPGLEPPYPGAPRREEASGSFPEPPRSTIFASEPPPIPISESENPDATALRSAISILQLQKQQSLQDIRTLDQMKRAAAADPEKFAHELVFGKLTTEEPPGSVIYFMDGEDMAQIPNPRVTRVSDFGKIPRPQNVIRMPPINWAKYHIVGDPLDKLHEEQRRRPSLGEPRRQEPVQRAPEHLLAAPYRPLADKIESPVKARGASKGKRI